MFLRIVHWDAIFRGNSSKKFQVHTNLNPNVGVLRLFPGITEAAVSNRFFNKVSWREALPKVFQLS